MPNFKQRALTTTRLAVVFVTAGSIGMAFTNDSVPALLEVTASMLLVGLFVPLVMGVYGKPVGERSAIWAILCGTLAWLFRQRGGPWARQPRSLESSQVLIGYFIGHSQDRRGQTI